MPRDDSLPQAAVEICFIRVLSVVPYLLPILRLFQLTVTHPRRLFTPQAFQLIGFVVRIRALEEEHVRVALEGQDMGTDAVEEPAVVADDHGTTCKVFQTFFQRTQGIDVNVIGRLVQQEDVAFFLQRHGQVQAVALAAGEDAAFLFLVDSGEIEPGEIGTGIDVTSTHTDEFVATGDDLIDGFLRVDVLVLLVDVGQLDGFAHLEVTAVGLFQAHDKAEQGGFTGSIGADDTHDAIGRKGKVEVVEQQFVTVCFGHMACFDASMTLLPRRGPLGMKISSFSSFSLTSSFSSLSYEFRRALPLACRALGAMRTHSNSRSSVLRRLLATFSSISIRLVFCSSQLE